MDNLKTLLQEKIPEKDTPEFSMFVRTLNDAINGVMSNKSTSIIEEYSTSGDMPESVYFAYNAYVDKGNVWKQIDSTQNSWALYMDGNSYLKIRFCFSGTDPLVWTDLVKIYSGIHGSSYDVSADCIAYWLCNDNTTNTHVIDLLGLSNAELKGGDNTNIKSVSAIVGTGLLMNGTDDYISKHYHPVLPMVFGDFTWAGWFKFVDYSINKSIFYIRSSIGITNKGSPASLRISNVNGTTLTLTYNHTRYPSVATANFENITILKNHWYFGTLVRDSINKTVSLYLGDTTTTPTQQGVTKTYTVDLPISDAGEIWHGVSDFGLTPYTNIAYNAIGLWGIMLTPTQITQLWNGGAGRSTLTEIIPGAPSYVDVYESLNIKRQDTTNQVIHAGSKYSATDTDNGDGYYKKSGLYKFKLEDNGSRVLVKAELTDENGKYDLCIASVSNVGGHYYSNSVLLSDSGEFTGFATVHSDDIIIRLWCVANTEQIYVTVMTKTNPLNFDIGLTISGHGITEEQWTI